MRTLFHATNFAGRIDKIDVYKFCSIATTLRKFDQTNQCSDCVTTTGMAKKCHELNYQPTDRRTMTRAIQSKNGSNSLRNETAEHWMVLVGRKSFLGTDGNKIILNIYAIRGKNGIASTLYMYFFLCNHHRMKSHKKVSPARQQPSQQTNPAVNNNTRRNTSRFPTSAMYLAAGRNN